MRFSSPIRISLCFLAISACALFAQQPSPNKQPNRTIEAHPGSTPPPKGVGEADKNFVSQASVGDLFEIQLGQMAQQKSNNQEVKDFGARMVKDHSANDDLLKAIAKSQEISLPPGLDKKHKDMKAQLSALTGAKFDHAYIPMMVAVHKKTIQKFEKEAATGHDAEVKKFAQGSVPTLKSHLAEAERINAKLKGHPKQ